MFDLIFLPNPSSKSTFAQNKSCRFSLPLQLLFWPNFKFLYEVLSFNLSNASQKLIKPFTIVPLFVTVLVRDAHAATGTTPATSTRRAHRRTSPSTRAVLIPLLTLLR